MRLHERVAGFCHRAAYAALLSAAVWIYVNLPMADGAAPPSRWTLGGNLVRWIDLPIAAASRLLPCSYSAIDLWFRPHCPHPIGGLRSWLLNHLLVGVPVYVLIFYLPVAAKAARGRWRAAMNGHTRGE